MTQTQKNLLRNTLSGYSLVITVCLLLFSLPATAYFRITEVYAGVLHESDGTLDWFELTNFGDATLSTSGFQFSDIDGARFDLPTISISPGESVIILVGDQQRRSETGAGAGNPQAFIDDFHALWGTRPRVVYMYAGFASGLTHNFDHINLWQNGSRYTQVIIPERFADNLKTIAYTENGQAYEPFEGTDGAYASNTFINERGFDAETGEVPVPGFDSVIYLVGTPGFSGESASSPISPTPSPPNGTHPHPHPHPHPHLHLHLHLHPMCHQHRLLCQIRT